MEDDVHHNYSCRYRTFFSLFVCVVTCNHQHNSSTRISCTILSLLFCHVSFFSSYIISLYFLSLICTMHPTCLGSRQCHKRDQPIPLDFVRSCRWREQQSTAKEVTRRRPTTDRQSGSLFVNLPGRPRHRKKVSSRTERRNNGNSSRDSSKSTLANFKPKFLFLSRLLCCLRRYPTIKTTTTMHVRQYLARLLLHRRRKR